MPNRTEKEKMIAGQLYRPNDAALRQDRLRARLLLKAYNDSLPNEDEKRTSILRQLLGELGHRIAIEPPFHCDYGDNIHVGDNFYANFNCIILDCAEVTIGKNVFLGPNVQLYTATHPLQPKSGITAWKPPGRSRLPIMSGLAAARLSTRASPSAKGPRLAPAVW